MFNSLKFFVFFITFSQKIIRISALLGLTPDDCLSIVNTSCASYLGCKYSVIKECNGLISNLSNSNDNQKVVYQFTGIPYALPPVGDLRFQKPQKYECNPNANTPIDATQFGPPCMQPLPLDGLEPCSEDCLYLNVYTPTLNSTAKLPVSFWIYGGGFVIGAGSQILSSTFSANNYYDGSFYAMRDIVTVTFNYRLGVFGFLYGNSSDAPGNQGIWDQAMALDWVIDNIENFGGDPNRITMFGQSAGSMSIGMHICSNVTKNKFSQAIMQSGSTYGKLLSKSKNEMYATAKRFASRSSIILTGSCIGNNWIDCLKKKKASELMYASTTAFQWNLGYVHPDVVSISVPFCPIYGDEFLPKSVNQALKECDCNNNITILIGHNEQEGAIFTFANDLIFQFFQRYDPAIGLYPYPLNNAYLTNQDIIKCIGGTTARKIAKKYIKQYLSNFVLPNSIWKDTKPLRVSANHAVGDYYITCSTVLFGGHLMQCPSFTGTVYQYRLTYANTQSPFSKSDWAAVSHSDELALVWGIPCKNLEGNTFLDSDRKMSVEMMDIWGNFFTNGTFPDVNGTIWPPYSLYPNGGVNASYFEINLSGKIHTDAYNGNDPQYNNSAINNCFKFIDDLLTEEIEIYEN